MESKPLSKTPNALMATDVGNSEPAHIDDSDSNMHFVVCPSKKIRPTRRETAKQTDAVMFPIDKVMQRTSKAILQANKDPSPIWGTIEKSLVDANNQMKAIAKQQTIMANHQDMIQAPNEIRENYFQEVYTLNILEAPHGHLGEESRQAAVCTRTQEAEIKMNDMKVKHRMLDMIHEVEVDVSTEDEV